jgi:hypothetical protein
MRIFNPPVFQGSVKKTNYFEGWYFKNVSADQEHVISFIPGISTSGKKPHAFIQMFDGRSGETHYFEFDITKFSASGNKFEVSIGPNHFSDKGFSLDIDQQGMEVQAEIGIHGLVPYPVTLLSPGIMGWYAYVPFMECYHGMVSISHFLSGSVNINGKLLSFEGGKGYIEKDWGTSFPECWIWLQGNCFGDADTCVMLSVAKIPFMGRFFVGFICFVYHAGTLYRFTTYTSSHITRLDLIGDILTISVRNKNHVITIRARQTEGSHLVAPVRGAMERVMKESLDSTVEIELSNIGGEMIYKGSSVRSGLEITGDIISLAQKELLDK